MATFVLVHGAWHGGWCWRKVVPLLRAERHEVLTPTLTGLGERAHLASADVSLSTHIQDVANVLEWEGLRNVVLAGHSYGGMVITGVADRAADRVGHLVYLDAFVPLPGESLHDLVGERAAARQRESAEGGWKVPPISGSFGVTDSGDLEWMRGRLVPQPLLTLTNKVVYGAPLEQGRFDRTYIWARAPGSTFEATAARLRENPSWRYRELESGHDAMIIEPVRLAELLLEAAAAA
ncbi:MAG: alpha/beta hydrolase [Chloroflexota bacterium]|nr:alpha/beta hydrolase [Chloroflexota bacterium]